MAPPTDGISNWMHLFRWIVKLIRDEYGVDECCWRMGPFWRPIAACRSRTLTRFSG